MALTGGAQITNRVGAVLALANNITIANNNGGPATLTNAGTLTMSGSGGPVNLSGVAFVNSGVVSLRLGPSPDQITSNAAGTLGGVLNVTLQPGFIPGAGAVFDVVNFSSRTGTFAQILGGSFNYTASYTATGLRLTAQASASANLSISKGDSPDPVQTGSNLTYILTIANAGPSPATSVSVVDVLPNGMTLVSATASQGQCSGTTVISCLLGTLPRVDKGR